MSKSWEPPGVLLPDVSVQEVLSKTLRKCATRNLHWHLPGLVYTEGARAAPTPSPGPSRLSTQKSEDGRRRRGRGIFYKAGQRNPVPSFFNPRRAHSEPKASHWAQDEAGPLPDPRGPGLTEPVPAPRLGHAASRPTPHGASRRARPAHLFPPAQVWTKGPSQPLPPVSARLWKQTVKSLPQTCTTLCSI